MTIETITVYLVRFINKNDSQVLKQALIGSYEYDEAVYNIILALSKEKGVEEGRIDYKVEITKTFTVRADVVITPN
jgi:hypothetical protein